MAARIKIPETLAAFACLPIACHTPYFIWKYFSSTPFWDFWNWLSDYHNYISGRFTLHDLIKPHNEHRIAMSRLLLLLDADWFHMTGHFVAIVNLALLISLGIFFGRIMRSPGALRATVAPPTIVFITLMVSICQWETLLLPFDVAMSLLCVTIAASAGLLAKSATAQTIVSSFVYAALAGLAYLAAVFSMAGGLLSLPWLILLLVLSRCGRWQATIFNGIAIAATFLFLYDYHPVTGLALAVPKTPRDVIQLVTFAAGFLGSSFYAFGPLPFCIGYFSIALFILTMFFVLRASLLRRVTLSRRILVPFTIAGTFVLIAFAAAVSRSSSGLSAALAPRYSTQSLTFLLSLLTAAVQLFLHLDETRTRKIFGRSRILLLSMVLAAVALNLSPRYSRDAKNFSQALTSEASSMRQNVFVPDLFASVYYGSRESAEERLGFLSQRKLGPFAPGLGLPPDQLVPTGLTHSDILPSCRGNIDSASRLDDSRFTVRGWVASANGKRTADWVGFIAKDDAPLATVPTTEYRPDLRSVTKSQHTALGIRGGVSGIEASSLGPDKLRVLGLFEGRPDLTCVLPAPLIIEPFPDGSRYATSQARLF